MKKIKKLILIAVAALVLIIIAAIITISLTLGSIIKSGIVTILPEITGTEVKLESFSFSILAGRVKIKNFIIGNPEGYNTPHAFKLGELIIDLDVGSITKQKIIIEEILISKADIIYETGLTENNLSAINDNIKKYCKTEEKKEEEGPEASSEDKPQKRMQIDKFDFNDSSITLSLKMLKGTAASVSLPNIHLENIGNTEEGATIGEVTKKVYEALYEGIMKSVSESGEGGTKSVIDKVKNLF